MFVSYKQYFFRLLNSRNAKKTQTDQSIRHVFSTLSKKKGVLQNHRPPTTDHRSTDSYLFIFIYLFQFI